MQTIRVLIVDDDAGFRRRIREFLASEQDILVAGEACDDREAMEKAIEIEPDVVLMDVRMAGMNGLHVTRLIKQRLPKVQVIILSRFDLQEYRDAAQASGASAYVVKRSMAADLLPALRQVTDSKRKAA